MTSYSTLKVQSDGLVATITLDRPEKRNAVSAQMVSELLAALDHLEIEPTRALIITGSGQAFCSGADLDELQALASQSPDQNLEDSQQMAKLFYRIHSFPKPVITAVNGAAVAGGCGIATLADFTIAVPTAKFGYPEVKIGFMPALVSVFLRRQLGEKAARGLLLSGRLIHAREAQSIGLVSEVVTPEALTTRARELASELVAASPTSIARTKRLLVAFDDAAIRNELQLAIRENANIRSAADFREGLSSFLEKRAPRWPGNEPTS